MNVHQISNEDVYIENEWTPKSKDKFHFGQAKRTPVKNCKHDRGSVFNGYAWRCKECGRKVTA